jgi:hypothetical protein
MQSAFECFHNAAQIEDKARQATSEADRTALLATSQQWYTLGNHAKALEMGTPCIKVRDSVRDKAEPKVTSGAASKP